MKNKSFYLTIMTNKIKDNSYEDKEYFWYVFECLKNRVHHPEKKIVTFEEFKKLRKINLKEYLQYLKDTVNQAENEDIETLEEVVTFEEFKNPKNDDDDK